jgi:hypothetical protein
MNRAPFDDSSQAEFTSSTPEAETWSERLDDYRSSALAEPDPLDANMNLVAADLMDTARYISDVIRMAVAEQGASLSSFGALGPAIESQTKIARELEKLANFNRRRELYDAGDFHRVLHRQ